VPDGDVQGRGPVTGTVIIVRRAGEYESLAEHRIRRSAMNCGPLDDSLAAGVL